MKWGIYDPVDNCWMGNDHGPHLFDDQVIARLVSETTDVMLGYPRRRLLEKEFPDEKLRLRDTADVKMSAEEALDAMENGTVL